MDMPDLEMEKEINIMDFAFNSKPVQFKAAFSDAMTGKISDIIAGKHAEIVASMNGQEVEPEYEVTDEEDLEDVDIVVDAEEEDSAEEEQEDLPFDDEEQSEPESDEDI
jgi:hypothetical protein